jgi:hypothetical protein
MNVTASAQEAPQGPGLQPWAFADLAGRAIYAGPTRTAQILTGEW